MKQIGYRPGILRRIVHSKLRPTLYRGQVQASRIFPDPEDILTSRFRGRGRVLLNFTVDPIIDEFGPAGCVYLSLLPNKKRFALPPKPVTRSSLEFVKPLGDSNDPLHSVHPYERLVACAFSSVEQVIHKYSVESPSGPIQLSPDDIDWLILQINKWDDGDFNDHLNFLRILTPYSSTEEMFARYPRCSEIN